MFYQSSFEIICIANVRTTISSIFENIHVEHAGNDLVLGLHKIWSLHVVPLPIL